jgi:sialate O-acetylesterase
MRTALAFALLVVSAAADVTLAPLFTDKMVLQRDTKVAVWGTAKPRERVTVQFLRKSELTKADDKGRWSVKIGPFPIHEGSKLIVSGRNKITLTDVCVGEVWICSGQSNMAWTVMNSWGAAEALKTCADDKLRLFRVPYAISATPLHAVAKTTSWVPADPKVVRNFSAVAYYFGRRLRADFDCPVGIVQAAVGGTPAEAWTRRSVMQQDEITRPINERWDAYAAGHPKRLRQYENQLAQWKKQAKEAWANERNAPNPPHKPQGPLHRNASGALFNGMIMPLVPYTMRGVIWYQGESNAGRAVQYRTLFRMLIRDWRATWAQGDFPFLFVQLPGFGDVATTVRPSAWAELREAQKNALEEPNTAMAVTLDLGNMRDIHPRNKTEVARRLALIAMAEVYGEKRVPWSGPVPAEISSDGPHMVVRFDHADGLKAANDDPLWGFQIAGEDKQLRFAYARVEGNSVIVWHPRIRKPMYLRYAWSDYPLANLVNGAGLPAGPFRTDDWPLSTAENR